MEILNLLWKEKKRNLDKNHLKTSFLPVTLEIKLFRGIGKKHPFLYQNLKKKKTIFFNKEGRKKNLIHTKVCRLRKLPEELKRKKMLKKK